MLPSVFPISATPKSGFSFITDGRTLFAHMKNADNGRLGALLSTGFLAFFPKLCSSSKTSSMSNSMTILFNLSIQRFDEYRILAA